MNRVTSKDGTPIAYERTGSGPAVILTGNFAENAPLAEALSARFTVYNYHHRGLGQSGDTQPYAVEREIEDLDALIAEAGGSAGLYGESAGGALALEAAAAGSAITRLAVYEVPYGLTDADGWRHYRSTLARLLAEGRRGDAFALFMRTAGASEEDIAGARNSPIWPSLEAGAHTLAYGAACLGDGQPPTDRLAKITQPALVITGDRPDPHMPDAIAASIPNAERATLEGQTHQADAEAMAPLLQRFFG